MPTPEEAAMFRKDFVPLLKSCRSFAAGFRDPYLDERNLQLLKAYASAFSKKYKTLQVAIEKGSYDVQKPAILLSSEKDFYNIFFIAETLVQVQGVRLVYQGKYHAFPVAEFKARFEELKSHLQSGDVYFDYTYENAKRHVQLRYRSDYGMIQVVDDDFMFNEDDPEFKLCMHYALSKGYDEAIDLGKYPALFIGRAESEPQYYKGDAEG